MWVSSFLYGNLLNYTFNFFNKHKAIQTIYFFWSDFFDSLCLSWNFVIDFILGVFKILLSRYSGFT